MCGVRPVVCLVLNVWSTVLQHITLLQKCVHTEAFEMGN